MRYLLYVDGACPRNGTSQAKAEGSFAVYALRNDETRIDDELHMRLKTVKPIHHESRFDVSPMDAGHATNNMAEASSLFIALSWCKNSGMFDEGNEIHICMDSELILNQVMGIYRTRDRQLKRIYKMLFDMMDGYKRHTGIDPETLLHLHHISGLVMKQSIIAH